MGILDDAIREHLELKRKHGVAEDELQRQEEEALGPARRDVAQQPEGAELAPGQPATDEAEEAKAAPAAEAPLSEETAVHEVPEAAEPPPADSAPVEPTAGEPTLVEAPPAERMREAVERLQVPRIGGGEPPQVTAS